MADFTAKIQAILDTSKVESSLKKIENKSISLKNVKISKFTLDTSKLPSTLQASLDSHKFTIHINNIDTSNITNQMKNAGNTAGQAFSQSLVSKINSAMSNGGIDASIAKVTAQYEKLGTTGHARLYLIQQDIQQLNQLQTAMANSKNSAQLVSNYEKFNNTLAKVKDNLSIVSSASKTFVSSLQISTLDNKIAQWMERNTAASSTFGASIDTLRSRLATLQSSGGATVSQLNAIEQEFKEITVSASLAGQTGATFGSTLKGALTSITKYISVSTLLYQSVNMFKQMANNVLEVDTAMTELYRVTNLTESEYESLYAKMTASAKEYASTLTDIINSTASWVRLGFDENTAVDLAEITSMYQHVTDLDYDTAVDNLVTAYKAYQDQLLELTNGDEAAAVEYIADIFDKLGKELPLINYIG